MTRYINHRRHTQPQPSLFRRGIAQIWLSIVVAGTLVKKIEGWAGNLFFFVIKNGLYYTVSTFDSRSKQRAFSGSISIILSKKGFLSKRATIQVGLWLRRSITGVKTSSQWSMPLAVSTSLTFITMVI